MSDIPYLTIECPCDHDVGCDWLKWPEEICTRIITEELLDRAATGRGASLTKDSCDGSHDRWIVKRELFSQSPARSAAPFAQVRTDGPPDAKSPSRGAVGAVSCEGNA